MTTNLSTADLNSIISAADEVITAIAGDNDDVHKDNSTKMCALWDDLNDRQAPPGVVKAMACEILASREASKHPVMYTAAFEGEIEEIGGGVQAFTRDECQKYIDFIDEGWDIEGRSVMPLYKVPQPAAPDTCKYCGGTGSFRWQQTANMMPCPCKGCTELAQPAIEPMKEHKLRELVNDLRDIAIEYHGAQQLRERIARVCRAAILNH
jgi:hypothetical protein